MTCNYCKSVRKTGPNTGRCRNINSKMDYVKLTDTCKLFSMAISFCEFNSRMLKNGQFCSIIDKGQRRINFIRSVVKYF
jgi:hypothetical protein